MEGYERDGVGEGYQVVVADDGTDAFYRHLLDAVCAEDDGEGLAQHVEEKGIHAEGEQHFRQYIVFSCRLGLCAICRLSLSVDELYQNPQYPGGEAAGYEHVARAPDALVDAEAEQRQHEAQGYHHESCHLQHLDLGNDRLPRDGDVLAAEEAYHRMGDGWYRAKQSLGIYRAFVVEVVDAEEVAIHLCQNIGGGIVGIAIAEDQDAHVDDDEADDGVDEVAMVDADGEQGHHAVAEGDALEHCPYPEVGEV